MRSLDATALRRALAIVGGVLRAEIERVDAALAARLRGPLAELAAGGTGS